MSDNERVVLASSPNPTYAFFYPITVSMWRLVGDREPICLLTGDSEAWRKDPCSTLVLDALEGLGADVRFIGHHDGWSDASLAQIGRLFGYLFVEGTDDVLTSDIDMWPLRSFPWRDATFWASRPEGWPYLSICYLQARAATWGDAMGASIGTPFADAISWVAGMLDHRSPGWGHDEWLSTSKIQQWAELRGAGSLVVEERPNNCSGTRLDRDGWPAGPIDLNGYVDAHVLRPGSPDATWERLAWVLGAKLPVATMRWVEEYRVRYRDLAQ